MAAQIYTPLDKSRREIRLLKIISVDPEITCHLSTISLDEASSRTDPYFYALSYVWGDANDRKPITVNGIAHSIATNLNEALKYAHFHWQAAFQDHATLSYWLWADALCINQSDDQEKNYQVPLMKEIYSAAWFTFCSLDSSAPERAMNLAFNFLETVAKHVKEIDVTWMSNYPELFGNNSTASNLESKNEVEDAMQTFLDLKYWSRVWIFQELILSQRVRLFYRSRSILLPTLLRIDRWSSERGKEPRPETVDWRTWKMIQNLSQSTAFGVAALAKDLHTKIKIGLAVGREREWHLSLLKCVSLLAGRFDASNPKDHVYALLGVTGLDLTPEYGDDKSVESVYIDLCTELVKIPQDLIASPLHFLRFSGLEMNHAKQLHDFPSWVPNFSGCFANGGLPFDPPIQSFVEKSQEKPVPVRSRPGLAKKISICDRSLFAPVYISATITSLTDPLDLRKDPYKAFISFLSTLHKSCPRDDQHYDPSTSYLSASESPNTEVNARHSLDLLEILQFIRTLKTFLMSSHQKSAKIVGGCARPPVGDSYLYSPRISPEEWILGRVWQEWMSYLGRNPNEGREDPSAAESFILYLLDKPSIAAVTSEGGPFPDFLGLVGQRSRLAKTDSALFGVMPCEAAVGDLVAVFEGRTTFSLIRKTNDYYVHVGNCSLSSSVGDIYESTDSGKSEFEIIEMR